MESLMNTTQLECFLAVADYLTSPGRLGTCA